MLKRGIFGTNSTEKALNWWRQSVVHWIVVFFSMLLTLYAWNYSNQYNNERAKERFAFRAKSVSEAVANRMRHYQQFLNGGVGLFRASEDVTRQMWHDYVVNANVAENFPGIQNMAVDFPIRSEDKDAHIAQVRAQGFPEYKINPEQPARPIYHSLVFVEPFEGRNLRAFGFDMYTHPIRRLAMDRAIDTGLPSMSGMVTLAQETNTDVQKGFIFCFPVFRQAMALKAASERQQALRALVCGAFRVKDLMKGILGTTERDLELEIFDEGKLDAEHRFFASREQTNADRAAFSSNIALDLAGRTWLLRMTANQTFLEANESYQGVFIAIVGVLFNILLFFSFTSVRRSEGNALRQSAHSSNLFKSVMDCTTSYVHVRDLEGRFLYVNSEYERVFSCKNEEVKGRHYREILNAELAQNVANSEAEMIKTRKPTRTENQVIRGDEVLTFLVTRSPLVDADGSIIGTCGVGMDITVIKRLEEEMESAFLLLRESEERWAFAIEGSGDGVWDWDAVRNQVQYSRRWKEMLGHTEDEVSTDMNEWSSRVHPDDFVRVMAEVQKNADGLIPSFSNEYRALCKNGSYIWVHDRGMVVKRDDEGKNLRMVGTITDISQRKEMERMKTEFISTVSHELRTPVTSIRGALGLLESGVMGTLEPKALDLVKIAHRNSQRLIALVNDILDMEKLLSGKMSMQSVKIDLIALLKQAADENAAFAASFSVCFALEVPQESCVVLGDAERIKQVIANLLSNAAKFSSANSTVALRVQKYQGQIRVEVEDYGTGIPVAFQSRIFEAFSQADSSNTRQQGSTGLGLNISKKIIGQMGGEMGFSTVVNQGSIFWFTLPSALDIL